MAYKGTAVISTGKLKLIRVATTTGTSSGAGQGRFEPACARSRSLFRTSLGDKSFPSGPAIGGCSSIHLTTSSGNSCRMSAGSQEVSRVAHGIGGGWVRGGDD